MRDPDLVQRAERAALALERAWDRWRTMHGFGAEPLPPVSSYVGYSLEEPWGQPRVVFGVGAEEAEMLAGLLDGHDCVGPVHAEVTASAEWRRGAANGAGAAPWLLADQLSVPAQAPQPGSEMLPTASQADVNANSDESAISTPPAPDALQPGGAGGMADGGLTATDMAGGRPAGGSASSAPPGDVPSGRVSSGRVSSGSAPSGTVRSGSARSGSVRSGSARSGSVPSGDARSESMQLGSVSSGSGPAGSGPSARGGRPDRIAAIKTNNLGGPAEPPASRPKPRKRPSSPSSRTVDTGNSGDADEPGPRPQLGPQAARASEDQQSPAPPVARDRGGSPAPPQPGIAAFPQQPESLEPSRQAEPLAPPTSSDDLLSNPPTSSDDLLPSQSQGHLGPRYQGYPPQYQDGPDPGRLSTAYAAAPVADSDMPVLASQPERGKSRQLPRFGRNRRQGPGAHEAWGSAGDQSAADHSF